MDPVYPLPFDGYNLANANQTLYVGTLTITETFGKKSGTVLENGEPIESGVFLGLVTTTDFLQPDGSTLDLDAFVSNFPGCRYFDNTVAFRSINQTFVYSISSNPLGKYTFDVKSDTYTLFGYYTTYDVNGATCTRKIIPDVYVAPGNDPTSFPDLSWP